MGVIVLISLLGMLSKPDEDLDLKLLISLRMSVSEIAWRIKLLIGDGVDFK